MAPLRRPAIRVCPQLSRNHSRRAAVTVPVPALYSPEPYRPMPYPETAVADARPLASRYWSWTLPPFSPPLVVELAVLPAVLPNPLPFAPPLPLHLPHQARP